MTCVDRLRSRRFGGLHRHNCGGSIITNRFVASVGYCSPEPDPEQYRAHGGDGQERTAYNIRRFIVYERFHINVTETNAALINYIALIQTVSIIAFN